MPRVTIDNREVDVPAGTTLLVAARSLGIDIPSLCWREDCTPNTTCMVCVVKVTERHEGRMEAAGRIVPACATLAEDGMCVESETQEVRQVRRAAFELLLSDHAGECRAPCQYACPFDMDVPRMIRQIAAGRTDDAIATLRKDVPLPAVLARVSVEVCEKACRRSVADEPLSIGLLKRYLADKDLASPTPHVPPCQPSSGRRVAIVGAGPAGLSAAYFLLRQGHACTLFDANEKPGGTLREMAAVAADPRVGRRGHGREDAAMPPDGRRGHGREDAAMPPDVLDAEIALIEKLGARFELSTVVGSGLSATATPDVGCELEATPVPVRQRSLDELRRDYDAVLIAIGRMAPGPKGGTAVSAVSGADEWLGLAVSGGRLRVYRTTHRTELPGVFAGGDAVRPRAEPVRAAADGKAAAACIDQYLRGVPVTGPGKLSGLRTGRPQAGEIAAMTAEVDAARCAATCCTASKPASPPAGGQSHTTATAGGPPTSYELRATTGGQATSGTLTDEQARAEAERCLHCDCRKLEQCKLRKYAEMYGADAARYRGQRRRFERRQPHPDIVHEPGKCTLCGLCIQIAERAGEPLGLTLVGRGFDVRVAVPFDGPLAEALTVAAHRCAEACPTGAIALRSEQPC